MTLLYFSVCINKLCVTESKIVFSFLPIPLTRNLINLLSVLFNAITCTSLDATPASIWRNFRDGLLAKYLPWNDGYGEVLS